jgi:cell wall-associated NlpC family hydrolase
VLAYARAQLGKWYRWGGEGPDTFDCSGLTMRAWQRAGVNLPHGARMQYFVTRRVSIGNLRPGDLVFFGSSPSTIHHVGIYVGGGRMIEAPRTGVQIRYSSIYRSSLLPYGGRP